MNLLLAVLILAGAGGGSGGFGGGGGGGGGGGFGGGGSGGSGGGSPFVLLVIILIVVLMVVLSAIGAYRLRKRRRERVARVTLAAAEAAGDDADFAADLVVSEARGLYTACQVAWDARDREKLASMVGKDLLVEWNKRLDDFQAKGWHNRVEVLGTPGVEYLGLVNREDEADDRVVVRITARQRDYVQDAQGQKILKDNAKTDIVNVAEWWTLARRDDRWICVSIEQDTEGVHHLDDAIVAVPDADTQALLDESLVELANADAATPGVKTAEIADLNFDGDARAAALDLSLADARFAPDVLEIAVRRAVAGWAEAVDGEDAPLLAVAHPNAVRELLYAGDAQERTRLVVRGPIVRQVRITSHDAAADPARMTVEVDVSGRRYVENRDTAALVSGSKDDATDFTERWTLAIDGPPDNPWRIVGAG
jgi:predicted lipid-binding transport protein (Tim44 family)